MIQNDAELRQYIPNALVTVSGEQTLYDKMQVELQLSEAWFVRIFGVVESTPTARKVLATDAFRVDRLISSLESNRDFAVEQLLHDLLQLPEWRSTAQGRYFLSTLYQTPQSLPRELHRGKAWDYFQQTHAQIVLIEQELAEKFISREVYARLRSDIGNPDFADLVQPLQAVELQLLTGKPLPYKQLIALTDYIRKSELFPEWQTSQTAELYKPHAFENKKDSPGYWF